MQRKGLLTGARAILLALLVVAVLTSIGCSENGGSASADSPRANPPPDISDLPPQKNCEADAGVPLTGDTAEAFVRWVGSLAPACHAEVAAAERALADAPSDASVLDGLFALIDDKWIGDATTTMLTLLVIGALGSPEALPGLQAIVARPVPPASGSQMAADAHARTEILELAAVQAMRCLHTPEADAAVTDVVRNHPDANVRRNAASAAPPSCTLVP